MTGPKEVELDVARPQDAPLLANLLELYAHDLSDVFALEVDVDGRFGYEKLPLYWAEPERRFPFIIRCDARVVGFALTTRGSPAPNDPDDFDVAEFFVIRRYRRCGVGRRAAVLLWNRFPGRWTVRVSAGNDSGYNFWAGIIREYARGTHVETTRPGSPHMWRVFSFDSVNRGAQP